MEETATEKLAAEGKKQVCSCLRGPCLLTCYPTKTFVRCFDSQVVIGLTIASPQFWCRGLGDEVPARSGINAFVNLFLTIHFRVQINLVVITAAEELGSL